MWLQDPVTTLRSMLMDQAGFMSFDAYLKLCGSQLSQTHLRFWVEAQQILMSQGPQQVDVAAWDQIFFTDPVNNLFFFFLAKISFTTFLIVAYARTNEVPQSSFIYPPPLLIYPARFFA